MEKSRRRARDLGVFFQGAPLVLKDSTFNHPGPENSPGRVVTFQDPVAGPPIEYISSRGGGRSSVFIFDPKQIMASNFGPGKGDDPGEPPRTPKLRLLDETCDPLSPDTEQNVAEQTDSVFRNFVYQMYQSNREQQDADDTPSAPELTAFTDEPLGPTSQVGRQLAMIGDDINEKYAPQFNQMIQLLKANPQTAYEAFAGVAKKLFREGNINWGRIITLLCFGYRMAVTVLERGVRGFFSKIVGFVCKFILVEKIAKWIADQGGWRAVLRYVPETIGWGTFGFILSIAALSVATAFFLAKRR